MFIILNAYYTFAGYQKTKRCFPKNTFKKYWYKHILHTYSEWKEMYLRLESNFILRTGQSRGTGSGQLSLPHGKNIREPCDTCSMGYFTRHNWVVTIRGQFHKAKKFVITRIIFVITNISNIVFSISTGSYLQFTNSKYFYTLLFLSNVHSINEL